MPGRCKTRLIPRLGAVGAARLHRALVVRTLRTAIESGLDVELWCAPDSAHGFFRACRRHFGIRLKRQPSGDLGRRMALALARGGILTGTDCPTLASGDLRAARRALTGGADLVLQPSTDGGYVLIAANKLPRRVLAGIQWSSTRELGQTRLRARRLGQRLVELPFRPDLDTPSDFLRARRAGVL